MNAQPPFIEYAELEEKLERLLKDNMNFIQNIWNQVNQQLESTWSKFSGIQEDDSIG